jgi:hypothetical protein
MKDVIKAQWDAAKKSADDKYNATVKRAEKALREEKEAALKAYKAARKAEKANEEARKSAPIDSNTASNAGAEQIPVLHTQS